MNTNNFLPFQGKVITEKNIIHYQEFPSPKSRISCTNCPCICILYKDENNIFNKIRAVKKKWKGQKYSQLIICPLHIKYIYFKIKRKLEREE